MNYEIPFQLYQKKEREKEEEGERKEGRKEAGKKMEGWTDVYSMFMPAQPSIIRLMEKVNPLQVFQKYKAYFLHDKEQMVL